MNSVVSTFAVLFATVVFVDAAGRNAECGVDLALVVDSSGSIRDRNVPGRTDNYELVLQFLSSLVGRVSIGPTKTRVAAVTYSNWAQMRIKLNQYTTVGPLQAAIKALPYGGGNTNTTGALRLTRQEVFSEANGDRSDVKNIIVLITDGETTVEDVGLDAEILNVKGSGITVFGIGVTDAIYEVELKDMVTAPIAKHYFKVNDFDNLMEVLEDVIRGTCAGMTPATTTRPTRTPATTTRPTRTPATTTRPTKTPATTTRPTKPTSLDGGWGAWSDWSTCPVTCGTGSQKRSRKCDSPKPMNGGKGCGGKPQAKRDCNTKSCPIDGGWGAWSDWSTCPVTCGTGNQKRSRECDSPKPMNGGKGCGGKPQAKRDCNTKSCPIDGGWGAWGDWSTCPVTCGTGSQMRSRECDSPKPMNGGKGCGGKSDATRNCAKITCPPRPTVPVLLACRTGKAGISSCKDRADGDYQSCTTCKKYVTCVHGKMDGGKRKCAFAGNKQLVWDDKKKYCDYKSKTCSL